MHRFFRAVLLSALTILAFANATARADSRSIDGAWQTLQRTPATILQGPAWVRPAKYAPAVLDVNVMANLLAQAPLEGTPQTQNGLLTISLPMPDGTFARFEIMESAVVEPALGAKFPETRTYRGFGIDDRAARVRLDLSPLGFHGQILSPRGAVYIDPVTRNDTANYASYYQHDHVRLNDGFTCETDSANVAKNPDDEGGGNIRTAGGATLRTYRLALAADGEYSTFFGGTVPNTHAALVAVVNRVDGIYETELSIRMILVANNDNLIYLDLNTDPYTNSSGSTMLGQNQTTCDSVIGSANYDIGHVVSTGGGGIAGLRVVGVTGQKARGVTGLTSPVGDAFYVDYVAHEMGHQYGGNHCFNSSTSNCGGGNRNASTAYEPGSSSTIMGYAGICGADNLQAHSDPYFHSVSLDEIIAYTSSGSGVGNTQTPTGNSIPTVSAGINYTIPKSTPFTLTATGNDADGDAITFCWEERDLGAAITLASGDNGSSPICRSWLPTTTPSRTIPRLVNLLANTHAIGEIMPSLARASMRWRCTIRDNRLDGAVNSSEMVVTVNANGPFKVTYPDAIVGAISGPQTATWDVVSTNVAPVNCATVRLLLSLDGGNTFPTVLADNQPNNGSCSILLPNINSTQGRLRVQSIGNIFFDISDAVFTIQPTSPVNLVDNGVTIADTICSANGNGNAQFDVGETVNLYLNVLNNGTSGATGIGATLTSLTPTVTVVSPSSSYPDIAINANAANSTPFVISVSPGHPCGGPIRLRLSTGENEGLSFVEYNFTAGCAALHTTCPGDMNLDGILDAKDVQLFTNCVVSGGPCLCGDFNASANTDLADVQPFADALISGAVCP